MGIEFPEGIQTGTFLVPGTEIPGCVLENGKPLKVLAKTIQKGSGIGRVVQLNQFVHPLLNISKLPNMSIMRMKN
jgi:hypothetical protein